MKSLVYETPVEYEMDLVARVAVVAGDITRNQRILCRLQESLHLRFHICIEAGGSILKISSFENLGFRAIMFVVCKFPCE